MSNKVKLFGVAGPAGAGKDTVGDWLVKHRGFHKHAFASILKAGLAAMGMPEPADRAAKELPIDGFSFSWRDAAQKLGTEWGRALDPDLWVKVARLRFMREMAQGHSIVVTDVRFENEADMIRAAGGTIIHLIGRSARLGALSGHPSEAGILKRHRDLVVMNDGEMEYLEQQLWEITNG